MRKIKLFFLLPALAFMACSKDSVDELEGTTPQTTQVEQSKNIVEMANPGTPGAALNVYFAGKKMPVENFNGEYVYQGDILLPKSKVSSTPVKLVYEKGETPPAQKSVGRTSDRWPNNTVYYRIDGNLGDKYRVHDAIEHWEANSNISFVKRSGQNNYINFVNGSGCSSYVGMIGGKQNITLSDGCSTGNTIHEIGHALGLWHEQMRVDADSYITVNFKNIQNGREYNFQSYAEQGFDGAEYTSSLDFNSIMLYGSYAFSKNGKPTMVKKNGDTYRAQRNALSSGDKTGINKMYPADGSKKPTYVNGEWYTVKGLMVYRMHDAWFYYTSKGWWRQVKIWKGYWFYI